MVSFVRISALIWADVLAGFAMFVIMNYLTNVWGLSITHAAGIINIWNGITAILPIVFAFFVDSFMGNYSMLLLSSVSYSVGLGLLSMSTPPVTGPCNHYKPECIQDEQKALFYAALALIAVGASGHTVSLSSFLKEQKPEAGDGEEAKDESKIMWQIPGVFGVVLVPIIGGIALPYIKPWSLRFGIPAICTLTTTLLFLTGSWTYKYAKPEGSPITSTFRVFVAATYKCFQPHPDAKQLNQEDDAKTHRTRSLRCLDKAAIVVDEKKENKWTLCTVKEVEETKIGVRMLPMWLTFIVIGIVLSIGNTYFLEQANHMNRKLGHIKVPIPIFLLFYNSASWLSIVFYTSLTSCLPKKYSPPVGIAMAMVFGVLCCITAAKVETRRLHEIHEHGLLDKPNDRIPMSIFLLLPQFALLAFLDGIAKDAVTAFFKNQAPESMEKYLTYFTNGVFGLGTMASVLSVHVVGKISEKNGRPNWFQYSLSKSRLDRYYWVLAALSAVNLILYIFIAFFYKYKESVSEHGPPEPGEMQQDFQDNANCGCC